ncbi:hypothetical protein ACCS64_38960, partial [Rhizobium ruizarguesonis]
ELARRGLTLCSGFFAELDAAGDFAEPEAQRALIYKAERYADFLKACGSDIMVIGAPLRQTLGCEGVDGTVGLDGVLPVEGREG